MSRRTVILNLDVQTANSTNFRIFVTDDQVSDFCLGLTMVKMELIETLQLSPTAPLRILKLPPHLKKKWPLHFQGYAVRAKPFVDLRLAETILDDWLRFYLEYRHFDLKSNVNHNDYMFYGLQENPQSTMVSITFEGAGYTPLN
ncbi:MAG TPA: hypothetical protein VHO69_06805 [Phototrophicaceae bacterium]|nr:hypothetical protein [Phototrophicaceae bacterium]